MKKRWYKEAEEKHHSNTERCSENGRNVVRKSNNKKKKINRFKGITLRRKNTAYVSITVLLGNPEFENKQ